MDTPPLGCFNRGSGDLEILKTSQIRKVECVSVSRFYEKYKDALQLELVSSPTGLARKIFEPAINRPGLAIAGFYMYFAHKRVQVFGASEVAYLFRLPSSMRKTRVARMYQYEIPCIVFSRNQEPPEEITELADQAGICVFRTHLSTIKFVNAATIILENEFAESTTVHGCMLDLRGTGILICGKSGVGKSEAALGLIERGGALVADDVVQIRNIGGELITSAPQESQGFIEVRGLGIVNVTSLFGLKALRRNKRLDLVVMLKQPSDMAEVERLGLERKKLSLMGELIYYVELPVAPGRDTARLIEVAAIDQMLKGHGYNMASEFSKQLLERISRGHMEERN